MSPEALEEDLPENDLLENGDDDNQIEPEDRVPSHHLDLLIDGAVLNTTGSRPCSINSQIIRQRQQGLPIKISQYHVRPDASDQKLTVPQTNSCPKPFSLA